MIKKNYRLTVYPAMELIVMRIVEENFTVTGYVDYSGSGEQDVITLHVDFGEIKVGSSICLPVRYEQAKLVLGCMNEAFIKAEAIAA